MTRKLLLLVPFLLLTLYSRKSDIENERLPPDIIDPEEGGVVSPGASQPTSPVAPPESVSSISASTTGPSSPVSPSSGASWRRGHGRQASLGTTKTSPSTRRRSLENTMELIRDVVDGRDANADSNVRELAEVISSPVRGRPENSLA